MPLNQEAPRLKYSNQSGIPAWRLTTLAFTLSIGALLVLWFSRYVAISMDFVNHFLLVDEIMKFGGIRIPAAPNISLMAFYPPGSHWLAAGIGWISGSGLVGIVSVSIVAVYATYLLIFRLAGRGATLGILIFLAAFVLLIDTHSQIGWEVVVNFFYAQLVADVAYFAFLSLLLVTTSDWKQGLLTVAFGTAVMWVHSLIAIHIFGCGMALMGYQCLTIWHSEKKLPLAGCITLLLVVIACAMVILVHPAFAAMRMLSNADGYLEFGYDQVVLVAIIGACIGIVNIGRHMLRRAGRTDAVLGLALLASSSIAILQWIIVHVGAGGSNYAVKKHMFLVCTLGAINLVYLIVGAWKRLQVRDAYASLATPIAAGIASVIALQTFATPIAPIVDALAFANRAVKAIPGFEAKQLVADLDSQPPMVNYMISVSAFQFPPNPTAHSWLDAGVLPRETAPLVMVRHSTLTDLNCDKRYADAPAFVVVESDCLRVYALDLKLQFNIGANGLRFTKSGWRGPEDWGMWSFGDVPATVVMPLPASSHGPYELTVDARGLISELHPAQLIDVEVNGEKLATWKFDLGAPSALHSVVIPENIGVSPLRIVFRAIDAVSPARAYPNGLDPSILGIGLSSLTLRSTSIKAAAKP